MTAVHGRTFFATAIERPLPLRGLAYRAPYKLTRRHVKPLVPFGWRIAREPDFPHYLVMPAWVYPFWHLSLYWRTYLYTPFIRLGFWDLDEGDYYVNGRWTWNFWRTLKGQRYRVNRHFPADILLASRWERFGWWIQKLIPGVGRA